MHIHAYIQEREKKRRRERDKERGRGRSEHTRNSLSLAERSSICSLAWCSITIQLDGGCVKQEGRERSERERGRREVRRINETEIKTKRHIEAGMRDRDRDSKRDQQRRNVL